jgi:hypothetical protein
MLGTRIVANSEWALLHGRYLTLMAPLSGMTDGNEPCRPKVKIPDLSQPGRGRDGAPLLTNPCCGETWELAKGHFYNAALETVGCIPVGQFDRHFLNDPASGTGLR